MRSRFGALRTIRMIVHIRMIRILTHTRGLLLDVRIDRIIRMIMCLIYV